MIANLLVALAALVTIDVCIGIDDSLVSLARSHQLDGDVLEGALTPSAGWLLRFKRASPVPPEECTCPCASAPCCCQCHVSGKPKACCCGGSKGSGIVGNLVGISCICKLAPGEAKPDTSKPKPKNPIENIAGYQCKPGSNDPRCPKQKPDPKPKPDDGKNKPLPCCVELPPGVQAAPVPGYQCKPCPKPKPKPDADKNKPIPCCVELPPGVQSAPVPGYQCKPCPKPKPDKGKNKPLPCCVKLPPGVQSAPIPGYQCRPC